MTNDVLADAPVVPTRPARSDNLPTQQDAAWEPETLASLTASHTSIRQERWLQMVTEFNGSHLRLLADLTSYPVVKRDCQGTCGQSVTWKVTLG